MKKWLFKMLKPFIKKIVSKQLENEEYQKIIIQKINDKIDIPKVDEETEAKTFNQIYDAIQELTIELIDNL